VRRGKVGSMQINHKQVEKSGKGDVGVKFLNISDCKKGEEVYVIKKKR
jgi:hypothetical protein